MTDMAIRKYYGSNLSSTAISILEIEIEIEKEITPDWSDVDLLNYVNHKKLHH